MQYENSEHTPAILYLRIANFHISVFYEHAIFGGHFAPAPTSVEDGLRGSSKVQQMCLERYKMWWDSFS